MRMPGPWVGGSLSWHESPWQQTRRQGDCGV